MKNILHIHQDYPDGRDYPYTKAVSNLLMACRAQNPDIKHYVLSINRTSNPFKVSAKEFEDGISLVYWAIPLPLIYKPAIWFWSIIIAYYLKGKGFSIIHGHKLTTEGLFSYFLSTRLGIPYMISIRGGSDMHNLERLPDLTASFVKIYYSAVHIFWVSAWTKNLLRGSFKGMPKSSSDLPNVCEITYTPELQANRERYCIILSYHQLHRKGLFPLLEALVILKKQRKLIILDIIGSGSDKESVLITDKILELDLGDQVTILGQVSHPQILDILSQSKGLLLPAVNETFGMADIEALACHCPILYMAKTGIDGFLDDMFVGVKLESQSASCIASGILKIENNYSSIIANLTAINKSDYLNKFTGKAISYQYLNTLNHIIKPSV